MRTRNLNTPSKFARITLNNLFEIAPDAILVTDHDGIIRDANQQATEHFGYSIEELVGMKVEALVPEHVRGRHPSHRENYHAHPRKRQIGAALELVGLRKDGTEFPVDIILKPMESEVGPIVLSFVRDATERRAAQDAMRNHDRQLWSIIESVRDYAIFMLDREGYILTWSPGGERLNGYTTEEIVGTHFSRLFTHEDVERGRPAELMRVAGVRGRIEKEGWRVHKDGSRFWADSSLTAIRDSSGRLTGYAKVTRDFTDRKRAAEAVMLQLTSVLLANMDVGKLLGAISASLREVIPHDAATLGLYDPKANSLAIQFLGLQEDASNGGEIYLAMEGSADGEAIHTREPVLLARIQAPQFTKESMRHLSNLGMQSGCWVPLIHGTRAIGTLAVASRLEGAFGQRDAEMLTQVAAQIAVAVDSAVKSRQMAELRERLRLERQYLEEEISLENRFEDIIGESTGLRQVLKDIETVAPTQATVLIQGETGTGKELLARAIHRLSPRKDRTFIKLNCAAIPAGLMESELFGHEKGAFTGAIARKIGRVELAHEGTLFLDEVGDLPLDLQPKLLRALQEREIERLGGTRPIKVDVRLIAASNRDLAKMVAEKQFRADLYYRLKVFPIESPPLRERIGDIPVLVRHFVSLHSRRMGKTIKTIPEAAMEALKRWRWPGNIRELENFLERAVILTPGSALYIPRGELAIVDEDTGPSTETATHEAAERDHILLTLRDTKGAIAGDDGAAARLGLKRTTLNSKIKKLGIARSDYI
jgi:PAS domain S-box-containing protein